MGMIGNTLRRIFDLFGGNKAVDTAHCESHETHCPGSAALTGLEVRFGRAEKTDRDLYDFKVRCGPAWQWNWMGLKFPEVLFSQLMRNLSDSRAD